MSLIKKIIIFLGVLFVIASNHVKAKEIKKIGKYKDW